MPRLNIYGEVSPALQGLGEAGTYGPSPADSNPYSGGSSPNPTFTASAVPAGQSPSFGGMEGADPLGNALQSRTIQHNMAHPQLGYLPSQNLGWNMLRQSIYEQGAQMAQPRRTTGGLPGGTTADPENPVAQGMPNPITPDVASALTGLRQQDQLSGLGGDAANKWLKQNNYASY